MYQEIPCRHIRLKQISTNLFRVTALFILDGKISSPTENGLRDYEFKLPNQFLIWLHENVCIRKE